MTHLDYCFRMKATWLGQQDRIRPTKFSSMWFGIKLSVGGTDTAILGYFRVLGPILPAGIEKALQDWVKMNGPVKRSIKPILDARTFETPPKKIDYK